MQTRRLVSIVSTVLLLVPPMAPGKASAQVSTGVSAVAEVTSVEIPSQNAEDFLSDEIAPSQNELKPVEITPVEIPDLRPTDEPVPTDDVVKPTGDSPVAGEGKEGEGESPLTEEGLPEISPKPQQLQNAIKAPGSFSTDLFSGSASYTYQLQVPEGRAGLTPTLALRYTSSNRNEFGGPGARGWSFEPGRIERTTQLGINKLYSTTTAPVFVLRQPGGTSADELVPVSLDADGIHGTYAVKVEQGFSLITFSSTTNAWVVVDRGGTTWTYGSSTASREANPSSTDQVSSWYLSDVVGATGATMRYSYSSSGNALYLSQVIYGGQIIGGTEEAGPFAVNLTWASVSDGAESYRTGYFRSLRKRLTTVDAAVSGVLRQRYTMQAAATASDGLSQLLTSIQETRYDAAGTATQVPATTFTYQPALPVAWNATTSITQNVIPRPFYECYVDNQHPMPYCGDPGTSVADINGDGVDDIVISSRYGNDSGGYFTLASTVYFRGVDGSWYADHSYATSVPAVIGWNGSQGWGSGYYRFVDLNGDRRADVLMEVSDQANGRVYINNGYGFDLAPYSVPSRFELMGDINGDGLPDLVYSTSTSYHSDDYISAGASFVYLNTGNGWQRDANWAVPFSLNNCVPWVHGCLSDTRYQQGVKYRLVDVNSDALPDVVYSFGETDGPHRAVFLNTGSGWVATSSVAWGPFPNFFYCLDFSCVPSWQQVVDIFDLNGDGGDDILNRRTQYADLLSGLPNEYPETILHNLPTVNPAPPESSGHGVSAGATRFGDFNGDGQLDLAYGYQDQRPEQYPPFQEDYRLYTQVKQPDYLLQTVTEPTGASTTLEYTEAHQYYASSTPLNTTLPYAVWTPSRVTVAPGNGQPNQVTDYTYEGGAAAWASSTDREFAGFWKVTATSGDTKTITEFHQGIGGLPLTTSTQLHDDRGQYMDMPAKRGRAYRTEVVDVANGNVLRAEITRWKHAPLEQGEGRMFVFPGMTSSFVRESDGSYTATGVERYYDITNGNEYETRTHGIADVNFGNGFINGDLGNDQSIQSYSYASSSMHILGAPQLTLVGDLFQGTIAEKEIRYDGLPLGQVSQGKPTRVEDKLPSSAVYATYDSYANVAASSDPRGATTTFSYDPTYHLVPTASTNPLGQTSLQQVDLATRQVASSTDANGSNERWIRDGFGRPLERWIQNPDAPGTVLAERWSYGDSARPVWVRHEAFDGVQDLDPSIDFTYADGAGRVIQTRALEATSTYIVSDTLYDSRGRVARQSLPYRGSGSSYAAPASGVPSTTYAYDPAGRVTNVYAPAGNTSVAYDGLVTRVTDALGRVAEQERDGQGRLVRVTRWLNSQPITYSYTWDAAGRLTDMQDPGGNTREFTYDGQGRLLTQTDWHATSSVPDVWAYAYDAAGNVTSSTDPRGATTHYTYDSLNRPLTANDPSTAGTDTTYSYDHTGSFGVGRLREAIHRNVGTTYGYDRLGRTTYVSRNIAGARFDQEYRFDLPGREVLRVEPSNSHVSSSYDRLGRWAETTYRPNASVTSTATTTTSALSFSGLQYVEVPENDTLDATSTLTVEAWVSYGSNAPANGAYTLVSKGNVQVSYGGNYLFQIDGNDKLLFHARIWGGNEWITRYAQSTVTLGDAGTGWHHYAFTYDLANGQVKFFRDGQQLGDARSFGWTLVPNNSWLRLGWAYDDTPGNESLIGGLAGVRIWQTVRTPSQIAATYNQPLLAQAGLVGYWAMNEATGTTLADLSLSGNNGTLASGSAPSWQSGGPQRQVVIPIPELRIATALSYTPLGQLESVVYGNGLVTRDTYTPADGYRLARRTTGEEGSYMQDLSYTYDAVGNVTHLVDASVEPLGSDRTFAYDALDRLVGVQGTYAGSEDASSTFSYDSLGNMRTRGDANLYRLGYNSHPYRASHATVGGDGLMGFLWDDAGNLVEVGSNLYAYDGFGRLGTSTYWAGEEGYRDTYLYDHAGQRALRTHDVVGDELDPSVTYYLGTYEEDDTGDARLFLDAPGRRLAQVSIPKSQPPAVQYLHPDALGSSPLGTGQSGDLASAVDQDPYGLRRFEKLNGDLPLPARSYTGKELDPSSWYYFGARYYQPDMARFTQIDPLTLQLQSQRNLQGILADPWRYLHPYAYASNNPLTNVDLEGNFSIKAALAHAGAFISGFVQRASQGLSVLNQVNKNPIGVGQEMAIQNMANVDAASAAIVSDPGGTAKAVAKGVEKKFNDFMAKPSLEQVAIVGALTAGGIETATLGKVGGAAGTEGAVSRSSAMRMYSARELNRRIDGRDLLYHNFPESFDDVIMGEGAVKTTPSYFNKSRPGYSNDSRMYTMPGSINGVNGIYEIATRPSLSGALELVMHRFFRPQP